MPLSRSHEATTPATTDVRDWLEWLWIVRSVCGVLHLSHTVVYVVFCTVACYAIVQMNAISVQCPQVIQKNGHNSLHDH